MASNGCQTRIRADQEAVLKTSVIKIRGQNRHNRKKSLDRNSSDDVIWDVFTKLGIRARAKKYSKTRLTYAKKSGLLMWRLNEPIDETSMSMCSDNKLRIDIRIDRPIEQNPETNAHVPCL